MIRPAKKKEFPFIVNFYEKMYQVGAEDMGIRRYTIMDRYPHIEVEFDIEEMLPEKDTSGDFIGFIVDPDRQGNNPVETQEGRIFYGGFIVGFPQLISTVQS